jgi:O-antigen ligase
LDLWEDCLQVMASSPLVGIGPHHFPLIAKQLGHTEGKEAHSTWLQTGAELGIPGLSFLLMFYFSVVRRSWQTARAFGLVDPEISDLCRMVIAALIGFLVAAQFVTVFGVELPFYVALLGAGAIKLGGWRLEFADDGQSGVDSELHTILPADFAIAST